MSKGGANPSWFACVPGNLGHSLKNLVATVCLVAAVALSGIGLRFTQSDAGVAACDEASLTGNRPEREIIIQPDDGYDPLLSALDSARCTIDMSAYLLTDQLVIGALGRAEDRGVDVRVILEDAPYGVFGGQQESIAADLRGRGVETSWGADDVRFTHAKYLVIDNQLAIMGTGNYSGAAVLDNRELNVITTNRADVQTLAAVFSADWTHQPLPPVPDNILLSGVNAQPAILSLIRQAQQSIDVYALELREDNVIDALVAEAERGVTVRIVANADLSESDAEGLIPLLEAGGQVRLVDDPTIHAKMLLIDGQSLMVGSINFSYTSLNRNREVSMILTEPGIVTRVRGTFADDWLVGQPLIGQ